jgi:hypothetical protein
MSNSFYEVLEARYVVKKDWIELYIRIASAGLGINSYPGGWCKKIIPVNESPLPALKKALSKMEYLQWDRGAPSLI